ncbi:hypothetical protein HD593_006063 [Nonomuraea rubra]|uniref:Secreted protein n=1 Tax=Nonomuraea rubra TaxID=46180 RepID=A0A7X0NX58_9ACTN|nr:hypothetical protein [Nonomuraea rubra]
MRLVGRRAALKRARCGVSLAGVTAMTASMQCPVEGGWGERHHVHFSAVVITLTGGEFRTIGAWPTTPCRLLPLLASGQGVGHHGEFQ